MRYRVLKDFDSNINGKKSSGKLGGYVELDEEQSARLVKYGNVVADPEKEQPKPERKKPGPKPKVVDNG